VRHALHVIWRIVKPLGEVVVAIIVLAALIVIPAATGSETAVQQDLSNAAGRQQADIQAAGGSPLAGDTSLIPTEQRCINSTPNPGMFATMSPAEGIDAARSNSSPCATFTGDFSNPSNNQVLAYQSPVQLPGSILDAVTGNPQQLFVYCCASGQQASYGVNQGHSVSLLNARTLQVEWTTTLDNYNASGQWSVLAGINYEVGPSGKPALLDPKTGDVLANINLPVGSGTDPTGVNFETSIPTPDGISITKTQTRPLTTGTSSSSSPCTAQGLTALTACKGKTPDSEVVAVDPDTMKVLDSITLPQEVGGRDTVGTYNGHTYIYLTGAKNEIRVEWDPQTQKLTFDKSWFPTYLKKGQGGGGAPCVLGKWVTFSTNAAPAKVSSSIVAISQANPNDLHRITAIPIGNASESIWPSKVTCDPETDIIYQSDVGVGQVAAVHIDPKTGELTKQWGPIDQKTFGFFTPYGTKSQRVMLSTNIDLDNPLDVFGVAQAVYGEQYIWRDARTGKELAHSNYVNGMSQGILPTPGYGGLSYMLQSDGGVVSFEVTKKSASQ
jgi:hypothetical protein